MNKKSKYSDVMLLTVGEILVAALTVLGAYVISLFTDYVFDYTAILGALLGSLVTVANFLFLTISVNRAVDSYLEVRGSREMTEEEAERFTEENSMAIQNKIKISYIIRTVTMLAAFVVAFVIDVFNPICTVIPLLAFRPILSLGEIMRRKNEPEPDMKKIIRYDDSEDASEEEKEGDE